MEERDRTISDGKFRKHEHILKSKDFGAVYKKGLRARSGILILGYLPNGLDHSRIGFSIGSRNVKLASRRNRLKRLFREAYRKNKRSFKKSFDMVLILKSYPAHGVTYPEAESLLLKAAGMAGIRP